MEQSPRSQLPNPEPGADPEVWLWREAHGDEDLYGLLRAKEDLGSWVTDPNDEMTAAEAREGFAYLNGQIARRRKELGLDPHIE